MKHTLVFIWILIVSVGVYASEKGQINKIEEQSIIHSARGVLSRVLGERAASIQLRVLPTKNGADTYKYVCDNGVLKVSGSSVSAIARGVYDYLKSNHLGMLDWSGPQFRLPGQWPKAQLTKNTTPFRIRHAYNVVISGYTTPYWDWERWEQELDWQAMHGFNMLMAPVATEAIAQRVWKRLGLTQEEIDEFNTGPAHLPWSRMGSICQVGGPLPSHWHEDQIALQHQLLKRMKELDIKPVIQSFCGFVPKGLKRIYPNTVFHNTLWNPGFPESQRPVLIMPNDDLFATITRMYMEEWQKEFGTADYFLVDSFNELELPKTGKPVTEMLADYGEKTFNAIKAAAPNATWVIQGWMFAYQRHIWNPETVKALFSRIPDDRVLILDYANDYNNNWEPMNAFNGKQWVYGFVPNMGGKTAYTGDLSLYAAGAARAFHSPDKKNLMGFTISGEGLENNNVVYELLTDVAWSNDSIDLDNWLVQYSLNRYGGCPDAIKKSWDMLRKSCYKNLVDHPQMGWQTGKCAYGRVNRDPEFFKAVALFLSCSEQLQHSPNYRADAIERASLVLGLKADGWFKAAKEAYAEGKTAVGDRAGKRGLELLTELDRLLESHPLNRLDLWLDFARAKSDNPELQQFYESNARQIITVWGPPVNDYSCRIWSGLVRDFYRERMVQVLASLKGGQPFHKNAWELAWVAKSGVSKIQPYDDPLAAAGQLVQKALDEELPNLSVVGENVVGQWSPANVSEEWKTIEWVISSDQLKKIRAVRFVYAQGNHRLDIREVSIVADGKIVATDKHDGFAGKPSRKNRYHLNIPAEATGNNGCSIKAVIKSNGGTDSYGSVEIKN
ncbi:alpha-N-acetylglucosaminidase [Saccharicrinis carchari]|uniref:Alpha-N-acetylglucosaminidase n=1 Tax=Saccharicrinis carchari TaxID=1168039 RepID=A0A521BXJ7_SACCC|nr:alpha-N-acetylglucosaminidase [Saccharicrinis carchari]SMO51919.1 alpha-N-acetylglucosaminidase [Saccharicrinis carchari]